MTDQEILKSAWSRMMQRDEGREGARILRQSQDPTLLALAEEYERAVFDPNANTQVDFRKRLEGIMRSEFNMSRW